MSMLKQILTFLDPVHFSGALVIAIVLLVVGLALSQLIHYLVREVIAHDKSERIDQIAISFISHLAVFFTWVFLLAFYTHITPTLHKLSALLLTGVGLASVVIGFAAQSTLGNLVSGISLVLYKPFRRGDRLQVIAPQTDQFEVGIVEDITLGFTVLKTDDGREIIISNGAMAQQTFIKLAKGESAKVGASK